jgi:hypothetical protein
VRAAGAWALALLGVFLVLLVAAALVYAGGSWADPAATRFDWLRNYWCDLMRPTTPGGRPNGASVAIARCAFMALAGSLAAFWLAAAPLVPAHRLARLMVAAGLGSALAVVAIAWLPHGEQNLPHSIATLSAGGFGTLAVGLLLLGSRSVGPRLSARHLWGAALLLAALVNIVTYVDIAWVDPRDNSLVPAAQKVATPIFALWMLSTVRAAARLRAPRAPRGRP